MFTNMLKTRALLGGLLYSLVVGSSLYADDTEVFFGSPPSAETVHPNVLFILDSSGSMGSSVPGSSLNRMENMKLALQGMLNSVTNVNIGLMRFNNPGGPILFPVSYVDESIVTATPGGGAGSITASINENTDDAEEIGGLMTMSLGSTHLEMAYGASGGGQTTITRQINDRHDDLEEYLSGTVSTWGRRWDMTGNQLNGLRFSNVTIPFSATINNAKIKLTARESDSSDVSFYLFGDAIGDSPQLNAGNKVSDRTRTASSVFWEPAAWSSNEEHYTPDLSSIVQEIIDRDDWGSGGHMTFIETHDSGSRRRAYRYRGDADRAAELEVTYSTAPPTAQKIGLRFTNIAIPQGATILSAAVEFTAAQSSSDPVVLVVKGMADDDAATFGSSAGDISMRPKTSGSGVDWTPETWVSDQIYQTADLSTIVQEIVDRPQWCGNNAMAFSVSNKILSETINRVAYSYDGDPTKAPALKITYDPDSIPASGGCINEWLYYRVDESTNDAEEYSSGGISLTSTTFNIQSSQVNGLRFENVRINNSAQIMEARLQLTARRNDTGSMTITLKGENSGNADAFSSSNSNISNRLTVGSVDWLPTDWSANATYESPDIKDLIQGIVNNGAWGVNNDLVLIQEASGSYDRRAYSFNSSAGGAALLKIKVQFGGTASAATYTVRDKLRDLVDDFRPGGYTPIVDTLYEASQYYRGADVLYGRTRGRQTANGRVSHPSSYTGGSLYRDPRCADANLSSNTCASEEITGNAVYTSPITDQCQSNYIVLLTDGQANHNNSTDIIQGLTGGSCINGSNAGETCGRELIEWMATVDQSSTTPGSQNIRTYTIGFNLNEGGRGTAVDFLQDLSQAGDGEYHSASTAAELTIVFQNIIREILSVDTSFVAPGATVNSFNRLAHRNEVYFSLFKPSDSTRWQGNMKRYGLYGSATEITRIVDVNGADAVDGATGYFKTTSKSWWSAEIDGNSITEGGAASRLPTANNRLLSTESTALDMTAFHESNALITKALLSIEGESDTYREELIQWARGIDVKDEDQDGDSIEDRRQMGDPLHSRPIIITYGGTDTSPDSTVFVGTNEGFLHAINTTTGVEEFAFIPQELLANLNGLYINSAAVAHTYGLDGHVAAWTKDVGNDLTISSADGDHVYIYFGMRRGGNYYYALDATNRANPRLIWKIQGGVGDFAELSQTWSAPTHTKIDVGGTVTDVLIFAGGYDTDNDVNTVRTPDSEGRAIFIVNAETGALIWSGGPGINFTKSFGDMLYSIPSNVSIVDIDLNGTADQLYVGDMGAQIWRFDINHGQSGSSLVSGAVIANLGGAATTDNRKFYYEPDIAIQNTGAAPSLSLSIGSGWRAHPLDTIVNDRFYNIRITDVYSPPPDLNADGQPDYATHTELDLYNATSNIIGEGSETAQTAGNTALEGKHGWYITLEDNGEKVLSKAITFQGSVLFTTYAPLAPASACSAALGGGYLYMVNMWDATPVMNLDGIGDADSLTKDDRRKRLGRMGIPPSPQVMIPDEGNPVILVGPETHNPESDEIRSRTYWKELQEDFPYNGGTGY